MAVKARGTFIYLWALNDEVWNRVTTECAWSAESVHLFVAGTCLITGWFYFSSSCLPLTSFKQVLTDDSRGVSAQVTLSSMYMFLVTAQFR
jgi:hypothetical protein